MNDAEATEEESLTRAQQIEVYIDRRIEACWEQRPATVFYDPFAW